MDVDREKYTQFFFLYIFITYFDKDMVTNVNILYYRRFLNDDQQNKKMLTV